ncbi:hypothetical protein TNCV_1000461 [Trichonephila clavipes]|nr:hypothetical protein TNCV_1000461 [Trichonephila clavipes]
MMEPMVLPCIKRLQPVIFQNGNALPHVERNQEFFSLLQQINFGNIWKAHGLLYPKGTSKASSFYAKVCGSGYN